MRGGLLNRVGFEIPQLKATFRMLFDVGSALRPIGPNTTYAQHGEDLWLRRFLPSNRAEIQSWMYVDVGCYEPIRLSNTYLLYRLGMHGVTIDPNPVYRSQHRLVRSRDVHHNVGIDESPGNATYFRASQDVLSTFSVDVAHELLQKGVLIREQQVRVATVDELMPEGWNQRVFLYSTDTEGWDIRVLRSSPRTLCRTLFVCLETSHLEDTECHTFLEERGFQKIAELGCNAIYTHVKNAQAWLSSEQLALIGFDQGTP